MTTYDSLLFNFDGALKIRLRPIDDRPRWRVNQQNLHQGMAFARQIAASFQHHEVKVIRHPVAKRYPCTLSAYLNDAYLAMLCKHWTKTPNRGEALNLSREFYESRRRDRWPDQVVALSSFAQQTGSVPFLVASLELSAGRHAIFVPFNCVEALLKYEAKLGLAVFDGWPRYPLLKDGRYDIDIDEIRQLITNLQAGDKDADQ